MGRRRRGRDRLVTCVSCGRSVPRTKAVDYNRRARFSSDLKNKEEDVYIVSESIDSYCISCAKHRGITQKKKEQMQRRRQWF